MNINRFFGKFILCIFSIVIAFIVIEVLLSITGYTKKDLYWSWATDQYPTSKFKLDKKRIYKLRPFIHLTGNSTVENTNSDGLRAQHCEPSAFRNILFIGDSFTWGHGVNDNETYPYYFSEKLDKNIYCVLNAGVQGYAIHQEYLYFKELFEKYSPETVIWNIELGDLSSSLTGNLLSIKNNRVYERSAILSRLYIQGVLRNLTSTVVPQSNVVNFIAYMLQKDSWTEAYWSREQQLFPRLLDIVSAFGKSNNVDIIFVLVPRKDMLLEENNGELGWVSDRYSYMDTVLDSHTDLYIDTNKIFRNMYESSSSGVPRDLFSSLINDGHYTKEGNQLLAQTVYEYFMSINQKR